VTDFQVEHLADFGTSEPWVARIMLGLSDIIGVTPLNGRDDVRNALGDVFYAISDAFNDLRRLRQLTADGAPRSELDAAFSSFYVHLWRAYKDRFQKFIRTLGVRSRILLEERERLQCDRSHVPLKASQTRRRVRPDCDIAGGCIRYTARQGEGVGDMQAPRG
jgi:hypothetical protein